MIPYTFHAVLSVENETTIGIVDREEFLRYTLEFFE